MGEEIGPWDRSTDLIKQLIHATKRPSRLRTKLTPRVSPEPRLHKPKFTPEPVMPLFIMDGITLPLEPPHMQRILRYRAKSMVRNSLKSTQLPLYQPAKSVRADLTRTPRGTRAASELPTVPRGTARVLSGPLMGLTARDCRLLAALERRLSRLAQNCPVCG